MDEKEFIRYGLYLNSYCKGNILEKLLEIIARLRAPDGCPWDKEQTHESIIPALIEEAYEVVHEIEEGELGKPLMEELGDLLLNVAFHAQIAKENGRFDFNDVVNTISEKLIRRHPHVFDPEHKKIGLDELGAQWEKIKADEKPDDYSALDGIPKHLPALLASNRIGQKAANLGFDWDNVDDVLNKIKEEVVEVENELHHQGSKDRLKGEIGDLLFSVVNLARHCDIEPESALKETNQKFRKRFRHVEKAIRAARTDNRTLTLEEMDRYWEQAKDEEKQSR